MSLIIVGLVMGVVFGFALEKSRVFEPGVLVRQLQLQNFLMIKVFFTAMATSMGSIALLKLFAADFSFQLKAVDGLANACGGALLGAGIALTGACPGTVLAQIGAGYRDALFTLIGGLLGAAFFVLIKSPVIDPIFFRAESHTMTLFELIGIPYEWLAIGTITLIAITLIFLEKRSSWKRDRGVNFDGC